MNTIEQFKSQRNVGELGDILAKAPNSVMRTAAAEALGDLGDHHGIRALIQALNDGDEKVRIAAEDALHKFKSGDLNRFTKDPDEIVRTTAARIAAEVREAQPKVPAVQLWQRRIIVFLIGTTTWFIPLLLAALLSKAIPQAAGFLGFVSLLITVILIIMAINGWNVRFTDRTGKTGAFLSLYKSIIVSLIAITGVGLIVIWYWTGNTVQRWWQRTRRT
jgi:hypothetical protein